jgi:putative transposase
VILTRRQKLRPTKAQHRLLEERLERQRLLYNAALQERCDAWRLARKSVTRLDQQKSLTAIRADDPHGHGADPANLGRWTLKRVDDAFAGFFSRVKRGGKAGFPRFKPMSRWRSFGLLEPNGLRLDGDRVHLKGISRGIRVNPDRPLPADARILGATFTRDGGDWYLGLTFESQEVMPAAHARGGAVGVDLGVEALATLSTGERIPNLRPMDGMAAGIRVARRAVARCRRGSKGRRKARERFARKTRRVARIRADHLHRASARLAAGHELIAMEDLRVANMTRSASGTIDEPGTNVSQKRGLNRSILDAGWSTLIGMVRYKAERAGGVLVLVDARHTSVECSDCGTHVPKPLSERRHRCGCGLDLHRDENAARVILSRGLAARAASEGGRPLGDANVGRRAVRRPGTLLAA